MHYAGLVVDFDGTLAADGHVHVETVAALGRFRASGRRLIMATGREIPDLRATFARVDLFDLVVAENGGLIYLPHTASITPLAPPPPEAFVNLLRARGVRLSVGAVIVATWAEHHAQVADALRELGLDRDVILNKGSVMVLPPGINKGTGVARAAAELALSLQALVGVGDAENDYTLLRACGVGVAVANAVPSLIAQADLVTRGARGEGVVEIIDRILMDDLSDVVPRPRDAIEVFTHEKDAREPSVST